MSHLILNNISFNIFIVLIVKKRQFLLYFCIFCVRKINKCKWKLDKLTISIKELRSLTLKMKKWMKKISLRAQRYLAVKLNFYLLALLKFGIFFYLEKPFTFKCNFQTILQFYGLLLCHPTNHRSLMLKVRERWK